MFCSPGTGLYSQLQKYQLPFPEAVFSINYFRHNPKPFYMLAKVIPICQHKWLQAQTPVGSWELRCLGCPPQPPDNILVAY